MFGYNFVCEIFYIYVCSCFMTFRPSDDVLEQLSADAQLSNTLENIGYSEWASSQWERLFFNANDEDQSWNNLQYGNSDVINQLVGSEPVEEIKSPDLSELLGNSESNGNVIVKSSIEQNEQSEQDFSIDLSEIQSVKPQNSDLSENNQQEIVQNNQQDIVQNNQQDIVQNNQQDIVQNNQQDVVQNNQQDVVQNNQQDVVQNNQNVAQSIENRGEQNDVQNLQEQQNSLNLSDENVSIDGKMGDNERISIISEIEWSVHSSLDLLVDGQWDKIVKKYKIIHHIIFRWWIFIFTVILWILAWVFVQVKANQFGNINIIKDSLISDVNNFSNELVVADSSDWDGGDIRVAVPYGFSKIDWNKLLTKSNLLSYKWIILPQLASIDVKSDRLISLDDFENKEISRTDLENLINVLIKNNSLNKVMKNLPNVSDYKWKGQTLEWWLMEGFSLWCMFTKKVSDAVCDKFLDIFYKYGKYYNLSDYDADLLQLVKEIKRQHKSVEPICEMIKEYVLHSNSVPSDTLDSVMNYCSEEDQLYYKKIVGFIEVENSLSQPELSSIVFDDPDINAYKLLSAQQSLHKILEGANINEGYVISYLNFVQNLINKDRCTHKYLGALYTDLLYVYNMDDLYDKLLKKGLLSSESSEIKSKIDQINKWNRLLKNESLLACLTTPNINLSEWTFTGNVGQEKTIEDIFARYYWMTDRLKIRRVSKVSDDKLRVQSEIFSDKIYSATASETLKATIYLYRRDDALYVEEINIASQPVLSDILNVYAKSTLVTFDAMIWYIDEQVWFWYKAPVQNFEKQKSLCEQLREKENIIVYNCDDFNILLYGWDWSIEYSFILENWILQTFTVSDEDLEKVIKKNFGNILFNKDNTPTIVTSIVEFELEKAEEPDNNIEKKLQVIDQFRIHFKLIPIIYDIEWEDSIFLVEFTLWDEFTLRARYNLDTHLLTRISYYECEKTLEIRNLTIEVSADNEGVLTEILNNPRIFLTRANPSAFQKYQKMCD